MATKHQAHVQALQTACANLPADFAAQARNLEVCRELLSPVLAAVRDLEDEVLGQRFSPKRETGNSLYWLEEDIFGSGFDAAEGHTHSMLEFLIVLACQNQAQPFAAKQCDSLGRFAFMKRRNLRLRQILFNNPKLSEHAAALSGNKWEEWLSDFAQYYEAPLDKQSETSSKQELQSEQFAELYQLCRGDFNRFVTLVQVLRSWSIDTDKDRQWCNMFLFPFGYEALFWEIAIPNLDLQQNNMNGAGQNVFCMLTRAFVAKTARAETEMPVCDLGVTLVQRFFADHNGLNSLAAYLGGSMLQEERFSQLLEVRERVTFTKLQGDLSFAERVAVGKSDDFNIFATRYLPYRHLPRYDLLLEDFTAISRLDLTQQELFLALGSLGHLHQICYLLEQEQAICKLQPVTEAEPDLNLVVLVDASQKTALRALSMRRLQENKNLFRKARLYYIRAHWYMVVDACIPTLKQKARLTPQEQEVACNVLRAAFAFKNNVGFDLESGRIVAPKVGQTATIKTTTKPCSLNDIAALLINSPRDTHMVDLHHKWGIDIGLVSKEGAVTYYYSLSDELLYYLVLALVPPERPLPLANFLMELKRRYHLVIGPHEAQERHYAIEEAEFVANEEQLKRKLQRNNLLLSLSDSCDYVRNPFTASAT